MELINTTGRYIIVSSERGNVKEILQPSETQAQVRGHYEEVTSDAAAPIERCEDATVEGLPAPKDDAYYVVTSKVARCTDRKDVVLPEFGEGGFVNGRYVGVRQFVAINRSPDPVPPGMEHNSEQDEG